MTNTAIVQTRITPDVKQAADKLFQKLGLDTATAIRMFLNRCVQEKTLALDAVDRYYSEDFIQQILTSDSHDYEKLKSYTSVNQAFDDILGKNWRV